MKTAYGKLALLAFVLLAGLMLFAPMRWHVEDQLYAYPRILRMNPGDAYDIAYVLEGEHAQSVRFSSRNEDVARVDAGGRVTAEGFGETQILLITQEGAKAMVKVEVMGHPITHLTLNAQSVEMEKGQVTGLKVSMNEDADEPLVEWISEDEDVARVDALGRVTAVGGGETHVAVVTPGGLRADARISVHVAGDAVHITPEGLTVGTGASLQMDTYYLPEDTTDEISHWISSDSRVIAVDDKGRIHAAGVGEAILGVFTRGGLSGSTRIRVEPAAEIFEISPTAVTLERGDALALEPRFLDGQGRTAAQTDPHYIAWRSSNEQVAKVEDGVIKGLQSGHARITAEADGKSAACDVQVQVLVHRLTLNMDEVFLLREETQTPIQLKAEIFPADPDDPTITYATNNDLVANVSPEGLVTLTGGYGTAIITAAAQSGAADRFIVNVVTQLPEETPETGS